MQISLAFSPCPNDTFLFDAWVNDKINTTLKPEYHLEDIELLNRHAMEGLYDITKISAATYPLVKNEYQILNAGAALGFGVGPLLVKKNQAELANLDSCTVSLPGEHTTAHFLFSHFFPNISLKHFCLFSEIEQNVINEITDLGVIIHESRFTYQDKGLSLIHDLGTLWEEKYNLPIPLGILVCKRSLTESIKNEIQQKIRKSVEFAFNDPNDSRDFVSKHAQEMDPAIRQKHIDLYVNKYSLDLGDEGFQALRFLLQSDDLS